MFEAAKTKTSVWLVAASLLTGVISGGQTMPVPQPIVTPDESPSVSPFPAPSVAPTPEQAPSASPARIVRISFVPPPLEGTISLGIYDPAGKLVRVLHQEAEVDEFTVGPDGLMTQWDGKNDSGEDLSPGKYRARGYLVGRLKVEDLGQSGNSASENKSTASVRVKLMPNPLANDRQSVVQLGAGFDDEGSYLKTSDDLPLLTLSEMPNLVRVSFAKTSDRSIKVSQDDGAVVYQIRVSNLDKMMAFDCGEFELK